MPTNFILNITIDGRDQKAAIEQAAFWSSLPDTCPVNGCGAPLAFFHLVTSTDDVYYGLKCTGRVTHRSNFGETKKDKTLYYKNAWTVWGKSDPVPVETVIDDNRAIAAANRAMNSNSQHISNPPDEVLPEERLARNYVATNAVVKLADGYMVADAHKVMMVGGVVVCSCDKFSHQYHTKGNKSYACEHMIAVRLWKKAQAGGAK